MPSATAFTTYLLFTANLVNQMGRVLVPAIKTTVLADAEFGAEFQDKVGGLLGSVSLVCLGGKLLGAAVTDRLGGWVVLIAVFATWLVAITFTFIDIDGGKSLDVSEIVPRSSLQRRLLGENQKKM